jgi:pyruvate dehydrogenase E1 component beta subunit
MTFNFSLQAIDQIINSAAKTLYMSAGAISCPIVFRGPNGAAAGVAAQHSQCFAAWFAHVPGLKVLSPYDAEDARGLLKAAIRDPDPVIFLENEILYGQAFPISEAALDKDFVLPIGKAKVMRKGADVTITAHSKMVGYGLQAAERLAAEGIDCEVWRFFVVCGCVLCCGGCVVVCMWLRLAVIETLTTQPPTNTPQTPKTKQPKPKKVINLRSLKPLDRDTIAASVRKTHRLVNVEEGWPTCGIGSELCAVAMDECFDDLDAPVGRVTGAEVPTPYAAELEAASFPTVDDIVTVVRATVQGK